MKYFYGIVEDRQDPLKIGRVRVRVHVYVWSYIWMVSPQSYLVFTYYLNRSNKTPVFCFGIFLIDFSKILDLTFHALSRKKSQCYHS